MRSLPWAGVWSCQVTCWTTVDGVNLIGSYRCLDRQQALILAQFPICVVLGKLLLQGSRSATPDRPEVEPTWTQTPTLPRPTQCGPWEPHFQFWTVPEHFKTV